jgi:hypothetical protein
VAHGVLPVDRVAVSTSDPLCLDVTRSDELGEEALGRTLSDSDAFGDLAQPGDSSASALMPPATSS